MGQTVRGEREREAYPSLPSPQALEEKEQGNAAYKKRDFPTALAHYDKAIELDPANVTFITNKAGVCVLETLFAQNSH